MITTESIAKGAKIQQECVACRVQFRWLGISKTLDEEHRDRAAGAFAAEPRFLSARKRLFNTKLDEFKRVTKIKNKTIKFWKEVSLPYPEDGMRLIRRDAVEEFAFQVNEYISELNEAVEDLDAIYAAIKDDARQRLADLFNADDYPSSLIGQFEILYDFPSVSPPDYLMTINPELYEAEKKKLEARFDLAAKLAEKAFQEEFAKLVGGLAKGLSGEEDGKKKHFKDAAVENLKDFFTKFKALNLTGTSGIEDVVKQCEDLLGGMDPQDLRDDTDLRTKIATELAEINKQVSHYIVERPKRLVVRPTQEDKPDNQEEAA